MREQRRCEQVLGAHLKNYCCSFTIAAQGGPVQHAASFYIRVIRTAAKDEEQANTVMEALVCCPVQRRSPVLVCGIVAGIPSQHKMKQGCGVAPLSRNVARLHGSEP